MSDHRLPAWRLYVVGLVTLMGLALMIFQLRLDSDLLSSMPKGAKGVQGLMTLSRCFDTFNTAFILIKGDRMEDVELASEQIHDTLKGSPLWSSIQMGGGRLEDLQEFEVWLKDHLPLLLEQHSRQEVLSLWSKDDMEARLTRLKQDLRGPTGLLVKKRFQDDPFDLMSLMAPTLEHLREHGPPMDERGRFARHGGRERLILIQSHESPMNALVSEQISSELEKVASLKSLPNEVTVRWGGAARIVEENARAIQSSIHRALWVGGIGLLLLFVVLLRSSWSMVLIILPSMVASAAAIGWATLIWHDIHVLALAFSGVLIGVSTDYALHAYILLQSSKSSKQDWRPIWASGMSTALAFAVMIASDYKCLQQAGAIGAGGVALATVLIRVCLPLLIQPSHESGSTSQRLQEWSDFCDGLLQRATWFRGYYLVVPVLWWAGWQCSQLTFDGDAARMDAKSETSIALEDELMQHWNVSLKPVLVLTEATDEATLYSKLERVQAVAQQESWKHMSAALWWPSESTQVQRKLWWHDTIMASRVNAWSDFEAASSNVGFRSDRLKVSFDAQWDRWETLATLPTQRPHLLEQRRSAFFGFEKERFYGLTILYEPWETVSKFEGLLGDGSELISRSQLSAQMSEGIATEFLSLSAVAALVMLACLWWSFGQVQKVLMAAAPVTLGLLCLLGGLHWLGQPADLMTVLMTVMIIGAGVDYGIVLTHHDSSTSHSPALGLVTVCASTTTLGLIALSVGGHPVFRGLGLTGSAGILLVFFWAVVLCRRGAHARS